jgi:hypothetical protein
MEPFVGNLIVQNVTGNILKHITKRTKSIIAIKGEK